ncbi:hypothetical protein [Heliorestis convoluta]|uniref:Transposase, is4 family domain protein n=1 Tax=Heliorestis convoluta TaxID=356322 RepID=A0A5Q2MXN1_9FIRM|nr:hypothetical protein [Heliorestis convoluta]QGG47398.1 transposase, is4 family domain protein [Heliorestis convoluta]
MLCGGIKILELPREEQAIEKRLTELFPKEWLLKTAEEVGFLKRDRKVDPVVFFWALVLGFGVGVQRTMAELRRTYKSMAGHTIAPSSFHDRFKPELIEFLKRCIERATSEVMIDATLELSKKLGSFVDVLTIGSTILQLHDSLADKCPPCVRLAAVGT